MPDQRSHGMNAAIARKPEESRGSGAGRTEGAMNRFRGLMRSAVRGVSRTLIPPRPFEPHIERDFLDDYARQRAGRRRVSGLLALVIWSAFCALDLWGGGPTMFNSLSLRLVGAGVFMASLALSFHPMFMREASAERLIAALAILCYTILLGMVMIVDTRDNYVSDALGLTAYLSFVSGITLLRAKPMFIVLSFCLVGGAVALAIDKFGTEIYPGHVSLHDANAVAKGMLDRSYIITTCLMLVVIFSSYVSATQREQEARIAFLRERRLASTNLQLQRSRRETESRALALVAAKEELRALAERQNREKSKFLADAAHDLSQPMHAVSLFVETTRHALSRGDPEKARALLSETARAAGVARSSFKAVLDISQLESGLVSPTYSAVDVAALIDEVLTPLRVVAGSSGVIVRSNRRSGEPALAWTDRVLLGRVIGNLVSNAIKYADPARGAKRAVVVGVVAFSDRLRVDVIDNGVGIPRAQWDEVFKPFVQLANPGADPDQGLGLGLSIVKATMDLLEGHSVALRSSEGRGTRVSLLTPRHWRATPAPAVEALREASARNLASLFIWCVEDDDMAREAMAALLDELGVLTQLSPSFEDLERTMPLVERAPDLVIADYRLSDRHTAHDVARLFSDRWGPGVPLLVVTGEVATAHPPAGLDRVRVLRKPVAPSALIGSISQMCFGAEPAPAVESAGRVAILPQ
jgi:signal transduction histidine kinase/CheY-like chemotaxis protein